MSETVSANALSTPDSDLTERSAYPFVLPPEQPSMAGPCGIRYDFNDGARVLLPEGRWRVALLDDDSGNVLFRCETGAGWVTSAKKCFVRFRIQVWRGNETTPLLDETLSLKNRDVLISFPTGTLGDLLGWFHYAERFRQLHGCRLECTMASNIIALLESQYPDIRFSPPDAVRNFALYATYRVGLFFGGNDTHQPVDFRQVGFHRTAGYILGTDPREEAPRLDLSAPRTIAEPYVCIAVQSTCQARFWNNGHGWAEVVTPSVIQSNAGHSGFTASAPGVAGSEASFRSNLSGTSVGLNGGVNARIRQNVTLGVQGGWSESLHGGEAGGYYGQVSLGVSFR